MSVYSIYVCLVPGGSLPEVHMSIFHPGDGANTAVLRCDEFSPIDAAIECPTSCDSKDANIMVLAKIESARARSLDEGLADV
jgi:hypothetical protein